MKPLKKASWLDKIKDKFAMFILRGTRVRYGPLMVEIIGDWFLIDSYGIIWRIRYTGYHENPIEVSKFYVP